MIKSYLFVPGNRPDRIQKAINGEAEAIIIDLEDAIPSSEKERIREVVRNVLTTCTNPLSKKIFVRINDVTTDYYDEDVLMVASFPQVGVMLAKSESAKDIQNLVNELSDDQQIIPLIESAKGVLISFDIASASSCVSRLAFGALDYCLDLDITVTVHGQELIYPRSLLAVASKAAGIAPPIDTVYVDITNEDGLIQETHRAKDLGMTAKLCIHPNQVKQVNAIFSPSLEEIKWCEKIVEAYEKAEKNGLSAIQLNNKMVDFPVYKKAISILERAVY
ncbi:HpcH/HpaI aldolase/citrate lyase family protein [Jeotgalibacillus soli]|uniref:HpcH/HpaI aldolase/citrate lyase domain-containing protein n=1 Tax=Jeotgalibacillus soli TaxID=889306 RepID=A0A0C2VMA3_9BACL|nr:CoA ester lyase [Jeotgalibacillus soli]KIL45138.1 hypothetical protein KP78_26820 [Jeotgalibacillus soli]